MRCLQILVASVFVVAGAALVLASEPFTPHVDPNGHPPIQEGDVDTGGGPEEGEYPTETGEAKSDGDTVTHQPDNPEEPVDPVTGRKGVKCVAAFFTVPTVPTGTETYGEGGGFGTEAEALGAFNDWIGDPANVAGVNSAMQAALVCTRARPAYCINDGTTCIRIWKTIDLPCWFPGPATPAVTEQPDGTWSWRVTGDWPAQGAPNGSLTTFYLECQ